jgi:hypothetical protein
VREAHLAKVHVGVPIVEEAAAAQNEQVKIVEDFLRLTPRRAA